MTVDQVLAHTKTETRRQPTTWSTLRPGDQLTLVEKGMGLKKGEQQRVLADVEVVRNQLADLWDMTPADVTAEGFPDLTVEAFIEWWLIAHQTGDTAVRVIKWRYL